MQVNTFNNIGIADGNIGIDFIDSINSPILSF